MADDEQVLPIPNLALQQHLFFLSRPGQSSSGSTLRPTGGFGKALESGKDARKEAHDALLKGIEEDEMAPYFQSITSQSDSAVSKAVSRDDALFKKLEKKNEETLEMMDKQLKINEENEGETEVNQVLRQKAAYLAKIGDKGRAMEAHKVAIAKAAGLGARLDLTMTMIRIGLFHGDPSITVANISKAKALIEEGGDWERRNRLKVYEGFHLLSVRDFKAGGELLLDALSTFTATELVDYHQFIMLTVLSNTLTLSRPDLKKKVSSSRCMG